jgi:uridine kinase
LDSFDYSSLIEVLLAPLGPGGSGNYQRAVFNWRTDSEVIAPSEKAPRDAILLFDGIFLHRPELRAYWDLSLFLDAPFEITFERMAARDGGSADIKTAENRRYVDGQRLYLETCVPKSHAVVVIDNRELASPRFIKGPSL